MDVMWRKILRILLAMFCYINVMGSNLCKTNICLDWELNINVLTLSCKITDIRLRVYIYDPFDNAQAVCVPPYPFDCEAYYKNGSMSYNTITDEIKFNVHGKTSETFEGYWTCRHGTRRDISKVFVTYLTTTDISQRAKHWERKIYLEEKKKEKPFVATWKTSSVQNLELNFNGLTDLVTVSEEFQTTQYIHTDVESVNTQSELAIIFTKFYGLFIGVIVLVLVSFIACNIWISQRCREVHHKTENACPSNLSNEAAMGIHGFVTDSREDNLSEYDLINENDMLPSLSEAVFLDIVSNSPRETIHSSKRRNSSSSEHSYFDVVDDGSYINPYQSIEMHDDLETVRRYSTISAVNYFELCFSKPRQLASLEEVSDFKEDVRLERGILHSVAHSESSEFETAVSNETRDTGVPEMSGANSESHEIKQLWSHKSTLEHELDNAIAINDNDYIFPSNAMNTLL